METRAPLLLSAFLIAGMLAVSAWAWPHLPETARIAVHFDFSGRPNGWMGRDMALLFAPGATTVATLAFWLMPYATRHRENLRASAASYHAGWVGMAVVLFVAHCGIIFAARGWHIDVPGSTAIVVAFIFIAVGNSLGKSRPNPLVGIRTPWTRRSDLSWDKSNRVAGRMLVATGLATLATIAAADGHTAHIVMIAGVLLTAAIAVPLSYIYWRRDPDRRAS